MNIKEEYIKKEVVVRNIGGNRWYKIYNDKLYDRLYISNTTYFIDLNDMTINNTNNLDDDVDDDIKNKLDNVINNKSYFDEFEKEENITSKGIKNLIKIVKNLLRKNELNNQGAKTILLKFKDNKIKKYINNFLDGDIRDDIDNLFDSQSKKFLELYNFEYGEVNH